MVERSLRIALDIDGVLAETHEKVFADVVREHYGIEWNKEMAYQWGAEKAMYHFTGLKLTGQEFLDLFDPAWERWRQIPITEPYAALLARDLAREGHIVHYVTYAKTDEQMGYKSSWIARNMAPDSPRFVINSRNEVGWKYEMDYDVFIEDCRHIAVGAFAAGKQAYLYDQPWNRGVGDRYITARIHSLEELKGLLRFPKLEAFP